MIRVVQKSDGTVGQVLSWDTLSVQEILTHYVTHHMAFMTHGMIVLLVAIKIQVLVTAVEVGRLNCRLKLIINQHVSKHAVVQRIQKRNFHS